MPDNEDRFEKASALVLVGLMLWVLDALVLFFFPAALKHGPRYGFYTIMSGLGVAGLACMITGYVVRRKYAPPELPDAQPHHHLL